MKMPTVYLEDHSYRETVNYVGVRKKKAMIENTFHVSTYGLNSKRTHIWQSYDSKLLDVVNQ